MGPKLRLHAVALPSKGGGCGDSSALPLAPESSPRVAAAVSSLRALGSPIYARRTAYTTHLMTAPQSFPPWGPEHPDAAGTWHAGLGPGPACTCSALCAPYPDPPLALWASRGLGLSPPLLSSTASTTPGSGCWFTSCRYGCMCAPKPLRGNLTPKVMVSGGVSGK